MYSILHPNSDSVVKTYTVPHYTQAKLLSAFLVALQKHTLNSVIALEREAVLALRCAINKHAAAYTYLQTTEFEGSLYNDLEINALMQKLLVLSFWRDTSDFADVLLYPTCLTPFPWTAAIYSIDYASTTSVADTRVDHSAYYYLINSKGAQ